MSPARKFALVVVALVVASVTATVGGTELPEKAAAVLTTGRVIVAYSATGRAQLETAIAALKDGPRAVGNPLVVALARGDHDETAKKQAPK